MLTSGKQPALHVIAPLLMLSVVWGVVMPTAAWAQSRPIYAQIPFDQLRLKKDPGKVYKISPLQLPVRKITPQKGGKLTVRLLDKPEEEFAVAWNLIEKVELFEELALQAAEQKVQAKQFDEAFDHYSFLVADYPKTQGLDKSLQNFLFLNAGELFQKQRYHEALSALEELYRRNAEYRHQGGAPSVTSALARVADQLLGDYVQRDDLSSARSLLQRLTRQYGASKLESVAKWRQELSERAASKRDELRQLLAAERFNEAHQVSREMLRIWPDVEGGRQLAEEAARKYPIVMVGTPLPAQSHDSGRMDDWAARRTGRLLYRRLLEFVGPGPEGGLYVCPFGSIERSEDLRQLMIQLRDTGAQSQYSPLTGYRVARQLRAMADPHDPAYLPAWAGLLGEVYVDDVYKVQLQFRRPNVLPEAMLQIPLDPPGPQSDEQPFSQGPYHVKENGEALQHFALNQDYPQRGGNQPAELLERYFDDQDQALAALRAGQIDVIDRLFPADAARLKAEKSQALSVGSYASPTLHLLLPNYDNPFLGNATFRRALVYGIGRQAILDELLLEGQQLEGCRVISGPFPAPRSTEDALSYAYDEQISPRPYHPRLAVLLTHLAENELEQIAEKKEEEPPQLEPFVLGHPPTKVARLACRAIALQLELLNITCTLKELPPGQSRDTEGTCHLVYTEVVLSEPVVDARRLLAADGIAGATSPYVGLGLRRLDAADDWKEVRDRLKELHQITHTEVTVIPLWQLVDHYAHHRGVRGIAPQTATLYQDIEKWQIEPRPFVE